MTQFGHLAEKRTGAMMNKFAGEQPREQPTYN